MAAKGSEANVIAAFGKARAANSLECLTRGEMRDAVYEALSAVTEPSALQLLVRRALIPST